MSFEYRDREASVPENDVTNGDPHDYETLMQRLRQVVEQLEAGQLPLSEALSLYEEGVTLAAQCQQVLDAADLRIQQLVADVDGVKEVPWDKE
jgi:exodeoxyribonuclease VII small subunit